MRVVLATFLLAALMGCATFSKPSGAIVCPTLVLYTPDQEKAVADYLKNQPDSAPVVKFMQDYGNLRAQIRACRDTH
jgi:hypothetical protein